MSVSVLLCVILATCPLGITLSCLHRRPQASSLGPRIFQVRRKVKLLPLLRAGAAGGFLRLASLTMSPPA